MADDERISIDDLKAEVTDLRALVEDKDREIEGLEEEIEGLESELADLEQVAKLVDDPDPIMAAEQLVRILNDKTDRDRLAVLTAIETGITSDLWKVF